MPLSLFAWFFPELSKSMRIAVASIIAVAVFAAGFGFWLTLHDHRVVKQHEAEQAAKVTQRQLEAERTASANDEQRRVEREKAADDLNRAREEAIRSNPDEASKPAGPAVRGVLGELRRQQSGS